jgi:D-threo-aldose 1-dehydrogenase
VVSTKVGRVLEPVAPPYGTDTEGFAVKADHRRVFDFTADGISRSLSDSLTRLGLDYVDIALIHDPDSHGEQALREAYPALEKLRAQGCVRAIGVGMNQAAMLSQFVRATDIDVVLVAGRFTLLDQSAEAELLPAALERGVAVLAGGVFNSGLLAAPVAGASYDYAAASADLVARARELESICARFGVPLRAAAARFPLLHPAVTSVLIGARSAAEITDALTLADLPIPAELWDAIGLGDV